MLHDSARTAPFEAWDGPLEGLLDTLGDRNLLQVMVEGGAAVAGSFHRAGLIDEYWIYMAPAIMGGGDGRNAFAGDGAPTMADVQRGEFVSVTQLGDDLRLVYRPS
jgi:diaminohydroxyphosphoribosylaminopyrimidine deaminase/5-amino-6-(5-phosphoribosylamino)uracil reductase